MGRIGGSPWVEPLGIENPDGQSNQPIAERLPPAPLVLSDDSIRDSALLVERVYRSSNGGAPIGWLDDALRDVLPATPTTMTLGVAEGIVSRMLSAVPAQAGRPVPAGMESRQGAAGRSGVDPTLSRQACCSALAVSLEEFHRASGRRKPLSPGLDASWFQQRDGRIRPRVRLLLLRRLLGLERALRLKIREIQEVSQAFRLRDLAAASCDELHRELARWRGLNAEFALALRAAHGNCGFWLESSRRLLDWIDPSRGGELAARLIAGGEDSEGGGADGEPERRLIDLAKIAERDPEAAGFLRRPAADPARNDPEAWKSISEGSPFRAAFSRCLQELGHRGPQENELARPRWIEDPRSLLESVRRILEEGPAAENRCAALASARRAAEVDLRRTTWFRRPLVRWSVARTRRGLALLESARSSLAAGSEPIRRILLEVGRRLCDGGCIGAVDDVFHLAPADVEAYLSGRWDGAGGARLAADRRARRTAQTAEPTPAVRGNPPS